MISSQPVNQLATSQHDEGFHQDIEDNQELRVVVNGGLDAWLCVIVSFLILCCVFGFITGMGQLETYYQSHQLSDYSKPEIAWIATSQSTLTFLPSMLFGRVFDAHGPHHLVVAGTFLSVLSLVAIAFSKDYYQLLLAHALFGCSASVLWTPATVVSGHLFTKRRSTAVGIVVCGSGVGGVVYPIMFQQLLDRFSFRDSILIIAGINSLLMAPSWVFLKTHSPQRKLLRFKRTLKPWADSSYAFLVFGSSIYMLNFFSPYFDAQIMSQSNHASDTVVSYSIAILQSGSFLGRCSSGILADMFGVWSVFGCMSFSTAAVTFAFWTVSPMGNVATIMGLVSFGFTSGAWMTLVSTCTAATGPAEEAGLRVGMLWTVVSIPILVGPVVCGILVQAAENKFIYAGIFCGISYLLGSILIIFPHSIRLLSPSNEHPTQRQRFRLAWLSIRT